MPRGLEQYDSAGMTRAKLLAKRLRPHPCRLVLPYGLAMLAASMSAMAVSAAVVASPGVCGRWATDLWASAGWALVVGLLLDMAGVLCRAVVLHYCHNRRWRRLLPAPPPEQEWTEEEIREAFQAFDADGSGWLEQKEVFKLVRALERPSVGRLKRRFFSQVAVGETVILLTPPFYPH